MKIIDLSAPLTHHMPVYPGDPEVDISEIHKLEKEGWNLRQMTITTHLGTHMNVPYHMVRGGKTLDAFPLDAFFGERVIYNDGMKINHKTGIIFRDQNIDDNITDFLIAHPPKFIGLSKEFDFDVTLERRLLEHGIISYENLVNTDKLPDSFMFYGLPLHIPESDGSPMRAYAIID